MELNLILEKAVENGASDIHLTVGIPPIFRINGKLKPMDDFEKLTPQLLDELAKMLTNEEEHYEKLFKNKQVDLAYSLPGVSRFRVNIYTQSGSRAIAIRVVKSKIPSTAELGLPEAVNKLTKLTNGLVLVTGPTGSGKSTTLAALIDKINREKSCHIITLEDPIEYLHHHQKSIVNQREIGSDVTDFASGLKSALRQDPDIILVGEMRDLETISTALTAAETGHLVFATLHTINAPQTIERIIDVFPSHQQHQIRTQLANSLQAIIAQQLIPMLSSDRLLAAVELLLANPAIRNLIREGKTHQILSVMQTSGKLGMQTMDSALRILYQKGLISKEELVKRNQASFVNY